MLYKFGFKPVSIAIPIESWKLISKAITWNRGIKDDRRTLFMYSEHVYKDRFWVKMSVIIKYCVIFWCNANTSHYREQILFIFAVPYESILFIKMKPAVSWKHDWASGWLSPSAHFLSKCIDCSPRKIRTHTLQTFNFGQKCHAIY